MSTTSLRVTILNWRDLSHPEGGGSERYVERVAAGLAAAGCDVVLQCSRVDGAPRTQRRDGYLIRRAGGRLGVYPAALAALLRDRLRGRGPQVVLEVQNGLGFYSRLVAGCPVVVLVHHVHREQWPIALGPWAARFGWWTESRLAPRLHRGCQYVTVSGVSKHQLTQLGVRAGDIAVVRNGLDPVPPGVAEASGTTDSPEAPQLAVLGRLVPHKRVEHALEVLARLLPDHPGLRLHVIGDGWWHPQLTAHVEQLGVRDAVTFHGFVSDIDKHRLLAGCQLLLAPSVKEGWGLMVVEAAQHGVPAIAYRHAGGLAESIHDGLTGLLVDDLDELVDQTRALLADAARRRALGENARLASGDHTWAAASTAVLTLLRRAASGRPATDRPEVAEPLGSAAGLL